MIIVFLNVKGINQYRFALDDYLLAPSNIVGVVGFPSSYS